MSKQISDGPLTYRMTSEPDLEQCDANTLPVGEEDDALYAQELGQRSYRRQLRLASLNDTTPQKTISYFSSLRCAWDQRRWCTLATLAKWTQCQVQAKVLDLRNCERSFWQIRMGSIYRHDCL